MVDVDETYVFFALCFRLQYLLWLWSKADSGLRVYEVHPVLFRPLTYIIDSYSRPDMIANLQLERRWVERIYDTVRFFWVQHYVLSRRDKPVFHLLVGIVQRFLGLV